MQAAFNTARSMQSETPANWHPFIKTNADLDKFKPLSIIGTFDIGFTGPKAVPFAAHVQLVHTGNFQLPQGTQAPNEYLTVPVAYEADIAEVFQHIYHDASVTPAVASEPFVFRAPPNGQLVQSHLQMILSALAHAENKSRTRHAAVASVLQCESQFLPSSSHAGDVASSRRRLRRLIRLLQADTIVKPKAWKPPQRRSTN